MVCSAGRATSGKIPISSPSNIQPKKAAIRTSHCARTPEGGSSLDVGGMVSRTHNQTGYALRASILILRVTA